MIDLSSEYS